MRGLWLAAALALVPGVAFAQGASNLPSIQRGTQEFTLSGTGINDNDFETGSFGVTAGYGWYLGSDLLISLRQSVNFADSGAGDDLLNGSTRVALDWHLGTGALRPFIGANIGAIYGDAVNDTGIVSPEAGLKFYVNPTAFLYGMVEYQILFEDSDEIDDNFDSAAWVYTVGAGFNF